MIPVGYECGFKKKLDVVKTRPSDWEKPAFDLKPFIRRVNELKLREPLLHGEGSIKMLPQGGGVILKRETSQAPGRAGYLIINRCCDIAVSVDLENIVTEAAPLRLYRFFKEETLTDGVPLSERILSLAPLEIALLTASGKS